MPTVYHKPPRGKRGLFVTLFAGASLIAVWGPFAALSDVIAQHAALWQLMQNLGANAWHWIVK